MKTELSQRHATHGTPKACAKDQNLQRCMHGAVAIARKVTHDLIAPASGLIQWGLTVTE